MLPARAPLAGLDPPRRCQSAGTLSPFVCKHLPRVYRQIQTKQQQCKGSARQEVKGSERDGTAKAVDSSARGDLH